MKKIFRLALLVVAVAVVAVSCGKGKENRNAHDSFSSFVHNNEEVMYFGSLRIGQILDKSEYTNHELIKGFIDGTLTQIKNSLNIDGSIYYSIVGASLKENPDAYIFIDIKNADSLKANLKQNGYEVTAGDKFSFFQDDDLNVGFTNNTLIAVVKSGVSDTKALLTAAFEKTHGDLSEGKVKDIISKKDDLVFAFSMQKTYKMSAAEIKSVTEEQKKTNTALLEGAFSETTLNFEKGQLAINYVNTMSDEAKKAFSVTSKDDGSMIVNELGKGAPRFAAIANFDPVKMASFISVDMMKELGKILGPDANKIFESMNYDVARFSTGKMGLAGFWTMQHAMEGHKPDMNLFVGLTEEGKKIVPELQNQLAVKFPHTDVVPAGFKAYTTEHYVGQAIDLPSAGNKLGKALFSAYFTLEDVDFDSLELEGELQALELIHSVTVDFYEDRGSLILKTTKSNENILKSAVNKAMEIVQGKMAF